LTSSGSCPGEETVFGMLYSAIGHESAGGEALVQLMVLLLAPVIGTWMLSTTSRRTIRSYLRKVLLFAAIGVCLRCLVIN
jgi:hypothetical protein